MLIDFDDEYASIRQWAKMYFDLGLQVVPAYKPGERDQWKRPALKNWTHPFMAIGSRFKELGNISRHRHLAGMKFFFPDAGWHFSGLGGIDALLEKIVSTSHTELALAGVNDADYLRECIRFGVLPMPEKQEPNLRNCELGFLPLSVFPEYLQEIIRDNPKYIVTDLSK